MNKPEYIHLLVNPDNNAIALCVCKKEGKDAIKISYDAKNCEIYSKDLMEKILALCGKIEEHCTYKLAGQVSENKHMITFNLNDAINVDE